MEQNQCLRNTDSYTHCTGAFIHSHFIIRLFPTPTLYSPWIKEISTRYGARLQYARSLFTLQNLFILLTTNPHTTPHYKHILRLLLRSWSQNLVTVSRLTTCSRNWQLVKETHHFELFFQAYWDAIQTRQGTLIPVTSSGGLSHLHREKEKA